ncbi:MAG: hypothetical protein KatS3mg060_1711 [Dehalococcoidia bacterium]|nr:MAG: hypothetical protein KatS3mg060_1711 [Dehalococcoidia bacterium]
MVDPALYALLLTHHTHENPHLAGSLIEHLVGTHDLLEQWGASRDLCNAGLFHSVYGTQLFAIQSVPFEKRGEIQAAIGQYAERIAYLFSVTNRRTFFDQVGSLNPKLYDVVQHQIEPVTHDELRDLIELEVANLVEFLARTVMRPEFVETMSARFESARHLISPAGMAAARRALDDQRVKLRSGVKPTESALIAR